VIASFVLSVRGGHCDGYLVRWRTSLCRWRR